MSNKKEDDKQNNGNWMTNIFNAGVDAAKKMSNKILAGVDVAKKMSDKLLERQTEDTEAKPTAKPTTNTGPQYKYEAPKSNFTYKDFEPSSNYEQAMAAIKQQMASAPQVQGTYLDNINQTLNQILNREDFSYDPNGDAIYNQYKDLYTTQGKMAMMDTMGQASALTGGYGNSYASTVGNQAYQSSLQQLNNVVPELAQLAYNRYQDEGAELQQQLAMYQNMDATEYAKDMDALNKYYTDLSIMQNEADKMYDREYQQWSDQTNFDYQLDRARIEDERYNTQTALQQAQLAAELGDLEPLKKLGYDVSKYGTSTGGTGTAESSWLKETTPAEIRDVLYTAESPEQLDAFLVTLMENGMPRELAESYRETYMSLLGFDNEEQPTQTESKKAQHPIYGMFFR